MHSTVSHRNHLGNHPHSRATQAQDGALRRWLRSTIRTWRRRSMIATFESMDDYLLRDIGIKRSDIARFVDRLDEQEIRMAPPAPTRPDTTEDRGPVRLAA